MMSLPPPPVMSVAAAAAQQDVAALERHEAGSEEALQAGDEIDVVELVFRGQQLD